MDSLSVPKKSSDDKSYSSSNHLSFQRNFIQGAPGRGAGQTGGAPW
jgi:hypothetical protein